MKRFFSFFLLAGLLAPLLMSISACSSSNGATSPGHELRFAAMPEMSQEIQSAPKTVSDAYRFAVANPEATKNVPCFCGCGAMGHTSNYDCYVQDAPNNGKITFDEHALGCSICVDITQDVMRMTGEGRAPPQIRQTILNTYSQFGPSNQP